MPRRVSLLRVSAVQTSLRRELVIGAPRKTCARALQWLSSVSRSCFPVAVLRAVLVGGGWPVKRCFLEYNADSELAWSLLETCLPSVCVAAAYQALP